MNSRVTEAHDMAKRVDCYICGRENLSRNEIALNKKLIVRNIDKFHCMQCLADYLEISIEDLADRIQEFRDEGCALFE
jgi:biotin operon repressor